MLVGARHDVGAAADHRLQRFCAAGKIHDLDVEAFVLEIAFALRNGERQVIQKGFAADRERDFLFLERLGVDARGRDQRDDERNEFENTHAAS